jgi:phosphoribosyl 1,2-cyclic phosphate phosphodiesterase
LNALRHEEHHSHFNLQQAVEFAKEIEVDRAYFLHISHYMGLHREVQEDLPSNIFLSYDTLEVDV